MKLCEILLMSIILVLGIVVIVTKSVTITTIPKTRIMQKKNFT